MRAGEKRLQGAHAPRSLAPTSRTRPRERAVGSSRRAPAQLPHARPREREAAAMHWPPAAPPPRSHTCSSRCCTNGSCKYRLTAALAGPTSQGRRCSIPSAGCRSSAATMARADTSAVTLAGLESRMMPHRRLNTWSACLLCPMSASAWISQPTKMKPPPLQVQARAARRVCGCVGRLIPGPHPSAGAGAPPGRFVGAYCLGQAWRPAPAATPTGRAKAGGGHARQLLLRQAREGQAGQR